MWRGNIDSLCYTKRDMLINHYSLYPILWHQVHHNTHCMKFLPIYRTTRLGRWYIGARQRTNKYSYIWKTILMSKHLRSSKLWAITERHKVLETGASKQDRNWFLWVSSKVLYTIWEVPKLINSTVRRKLYASGETTIFIHFALSITYIYVYKPS